MEKETLVIVDVQFGFCNKKGGLYVKNGEKIITPIANYIKKNHKKIDQVIFTLDWHPYEEESYKEPNITWPMHCMQFSEDAAIPNKLIKTCLNNDVKFTFFPKGNCSKIDYFMDHFHTEYGAFEKIDIYKDKVMLCNRREDAIINLNTTILVVCGIAGDYCVLNTIKNILKSNSDYSASDDVALKVKVFKDGIVSIDDGKTLNDFIEQNKLEIV